MVIDLYVFSCKAVLFEVEMDKETASNSDASGIAAALQNLNYWRLARLAKARPRYSTRPTRNFTFLRDLLTSPIPSAFKRTS